MVLTGYYRFHQSKYATHAPAITLLPRAVEICGNALSKLWLIRPFYWYWNHNSCVRPLQWLINGIYSHSTSNLALFQTILQSHILSENIFATSVPFYVPWAPVANGRAMTSANNKYCLIWQYRSFIICYHNFMEFVELGRVTATVSQRHEHPRTFRRTQLNILGPYENTILAWEFGLYFKYFDQLYL